MAQIIYKWSSRVIFDIELIHQNVNPGLAWSKILKFLKSGKIEEIKNPSDELHMFYESNMTEFS